MAKAKHGNKYDYSQVEYINNHSPVLIICKEHGPIWQNASSHLRAECQCCAPNRKLTQTEFIQKSLKIHNNKYTYEATIYKNNRSHVTIICPIHGEFSQKAHTHLNGKGCPDCGKWRCCSKSETEWLDEIQTKVPKLKRQVKLIINGKRFCVDGFDPQTNTVYEFNGDFFHGNPKYHDPIFLNHVSNKSFGDLYANTLKRKQSLENAGYKVISIWDSEFKAKKQRRYTSKPITTQQKHMNRHTLIRLLENANDQDFSHIFAL